MKISGIIRKLKRSGDPKLKSYAGIIAHMEHNGFFASIRDQVENAKYQKIEDMLTQVSRSINPKYGVETGQILRAVFIGFISNANGKRKPRS